MVVACNASLVGSKEDTVLLEVVTRTRRFILNNTHMSGMGIGQYVLSVQVLF